MAGDLALHRVEPIRPADTGRQAVDAAENLPAHAVARRLGFGGTAAQILLVHDVGAYSDPLCGQHRFGNAARRRQRSGEPAGKMAAAPVVIEALCLYTGGKISVSRPRHSAQGIIVPGMHVAVGDHHDQRHTGGAAPEHAGEELHRIGLPPGRGQRIRGAAAQQLPLHLQGVHRNPRRHMPQQHPHHRAVRLPEQRIVQHSHSPLSVEYFHFSA